MFSEADHNRKIKHQLEYRLSQIPEEYYSAWNEKSVDELNKITETVTNSLSRPSIMNEDREHMQKILKWLTTLIESKEEGLPNRDVFTRS